MKYKLIIGIALIIVISCCIISDTDNVSAGTTTGNGTQSSPYSFVNVNTLEFNDIFGYPVGTPEHKYVEIGASFTVIPTSDQNIDYYITAVTPNKGLTINNGTLSGTISGNNNDVISVTISYYDEFDENPQEQVYGTRTFTILTPKYTVTWKNWDGTVLETDTNVLAGTTPTYNGPTPTRPSEQSTNYSFTGWSPAVGPITGDTIYTAQYTTTISTYTITWKNWDGTVLETDTNVSYNSTPTYNGATPTRTSSSIYTYTFSGWTPTLTPVTADQIYIAQYTSNPIINVIGDGTPEDTYSYIGLYANDLDQYFMGNKYVRTGTTLSIFPFDDDDFSYFSYEITSGHGLTIDGNWLLTGTVTGNNGDVVEIKIGISDGYDTGTQIYKFIIVDLSIKYTVTWKNWDGTVLETDTNLTYAITPTYDGVTPTKPSENGITYSFTGWSPAVGPITGDTIYTAQFGELITYWSNGNPNGSISILFHIDKPNITNKMYIKCPLYKYNPNIPDNPETEIIESFITTEKYIGIYFESIKVGSTNSVSISAGLYNDNNSLINAGETINLGSWKTFIVTIDTINAEITYTKVMGFRSFTNYEETSTTGLIYSYGSLGNYNGQVTEEIEFHPMAPAVPKQSIVKTSVFLNTYGVVLRDPSLDIATYFPEMTQMRLNFYSFALYGSSMTINGHTINVTAPNVTIYYTTNANGNIFSDIPGTNTKEKTLELTNIYITWDGENCYLTFADADFTVDMGTYSNKVVSFAGMWYFATALWEPYTAQETTYDIDWFNFDFALFGIIFATMLLIASLILKVTIGAKFLDYIIIVCGIIIGLIIAGGSL